MTLKKGLKEFKEVLKHHTIEEIIEEGIRITLAFPNTWSPNTEWSNFMWGFGNAWMNFYKTIIGNKKDVAATFPIGDVLNKENVMVEDPLKEVDVTSILGNPYNVVLFNDDIHSGDEVQAQVVKATGCSMERAFRIMYEAHANGRAIAYTGGKERCELVESILAEIKLMTKIEQA